MADLRQILSQGRKRIGLLVGAGAPLAIRVNAAGELDDAGVPLVPGVDEMTKKVLDGLTGVNSKAAMAIKGDLGEGANIEPFCPASVFLKR